MAEETGVLDEYTWDNSKSKTFDECAGGETISSNWEMSYAITADTNSQFNFDEIPQYGSNRIRFVTHFRDRPESIIRSLCDSGQIPSVTEPVPHNFEASIRPANSEESDLFGFSQPIPQDGWGDSTNESDGYLNDILSITGSIGNVYTSLGSIAVKYLIDEESGAASVALTGEEGIEFDIPLEGGYDDLPHEGGDNPTLEVSARINNQYSSGEHYFLYIPKYTFRYLEHYDSRCGSCSNWSYKYKSTSPLIDGYAGLTVV